MKFIASVVSIAISASCIIVTSNVHTVNANLVHHVLRENLIGDSTNKAKFNLRTGSRKLEESASDSESLSESEDSPSSDEAARKLEESASDSESLSESEDSPSSDEAARKLEDVEGEESESLDEGESLSDSLDESGSESEDTIDGVDNSDGLVQMNGQDDRTGLVQMLDYQSGATLMSGNGVASAFLGIMMVGLAHII